MKKVEAIKYFGSQQAIADVLGLHKSAISQWGEEVPELRAFQLREVMNNPTAVDDTQSDAA